MRYIQSKRIFGPQKIGNSGGTALYVTPAGRTAVIRFLTIVNTGATVSGTLRASLGSNLTSAQVFRSTLAAGAGLNLDVRYVLQEGQDFRIWVQETTADITVSAHGFLFFDPA